MGAKEQEEQEKKEAVGNEDANEEEKAGKTKKKKVGRGFRFQQFGRQPRTPLARVREGTPLCGRGGGPRMDPTSLLQVSGRGTDPPMMLSGREEVENKGGGKPRWKGN